ncbi:MAG: hypothetical protein R2856_26010 [Caldilineaceae bacterium]
MVESSIDDADSDGVVTSSTPTMLTLNNDTDGDGVGKPTKASLAPTRRTATPTATAKAIAEIGGDEQPAGHRRRRRT